MTWQPIKTAPKDGTRILVVWPDRSISIAWWTTNPRIIDKHLSLGWQFSHFIDHHEWDDYEISKKENQPTNLMLLPELPDHEVVFCA